MLLELLIAVLVALGLAKLIEPLVSHALGRLAAGNSSAALEQTLRKTPGAAEAPPNAGQSPPGPAESVTQSRPQKKLRCDSPVEAYLKGRSEAANPERIDNMDGSQRKDGVE